MLNRINELWQDIVGFEGRYQVSNYGEIKSIQNNHGNTQDRKKSTYISSNGYVYVQLFFKNKHFNVSVHSAVANAFIPNYENKPTVNHIDGNKQNNQVSNLEWATYSENLKHAHATGLKVGKCWCKGKKWGKTSNFHNVTYDPTRDRWIASIKYNGKMYAKRFSVKKYGDQAELQAALAVNILLDELGITDRTKNIIS